MVSAEINLQSVSMHITDHRLVDTRPGRGALLELFDGVVPHVTSKVDPVLE